MMQPLLSSQRLKHFLIPFSGKTMGLVAWGIVVLIGPLAELLIAAEEAKPVARWTFGQEESTPLESHGGVHRDVPGPRPETYPDFSPDNTAVRLDGNGARFIFADPGVDSPFDFTNGDEITMEAWVKIDRINPGENVYVIGKGRTGNPGFSTKNQNWSLRVCEREGRIRISFLFSSVPQTPQASSKDANWHLWISDQGFKQGKNWHHIAIAYRFGDPKSLLGVIDGKQVTGRWSAGGPTQAAPTVDNDDIWIGSALGGASATSFRGDLDEVAIYRKAIPFAVLKSRYRGPDVAFVDKPLPETMPELGNLSAGKVHVSFHEGMPNHFRWLNEGESVPVETLNWQTNAFLFDRLPQRYDSWGIREAWNAPVLVRMAADVSLPPGQHRFLMRVRGLSRLWVDGTLVARGNPIRGGQDGFEPMTPPATPPKPGLRIAEHRQQEVFGDFESSAGGTHRIVLETLVGGRSFRADPGETCVAVETVDGTSWNLLQPGEMRKLSLTDDVVTSLLAEQSTAMQHFDDQRRRAAAATQAPFWNERHAFARNWGEKHPAAAVPNPHEHLHPIDAFLKEKVQSALAASSQTPPSDAIWFHKEVLPILRTQCFRCHGEKAQGGLHLDSLEGAKAGGDSGLPAVYPGKLQSSELLSRVRSDSPEERMPPGATGLRPEQISILEDWIRRGAIWPAPPVASDVVTAPPILDDESFLRRVFLDTVGVIPSDEEVREFLADKSADKRNRWIDRLLADERWADHWMSYWQDVLAENPTLLNASLNTTGPFRWFIYDSLRDNKPFDRLVTELILLRGSVYEGGSAGFGIAADNDAPFAAKGQILSSAFLAIELQCARCHDSPYHSTLQRDLYALAAMMQRKPVTVPSSSRVPEAFFEKQQRESLIRVTLKPGEPVQPAWPFAEVTGSVDDETLLPLVRNDKDSREKLAALITSPRNRRFSEVIVNRVWRRFIGAGIVEPPDDWEGKTPSHPELLKWLARDFTMHGYDLKHLCRIILTSQLYQRQATRSTLPVSPEMRFFASPVRRRMSAEQVVDSLCVAVGKPMNVEEMTFAPEAGRPSSNRLSLGVPHRAWELANLANERDRPSLSLPRARAIVDILQAFGWNGSRQSPRTDRDREPNVLQPGILQNSNAAILLTRATHQSELADIAVNADSPDQLVETIFLKALSRYPTPDERALLTPLLADGFQDRVLPEAERAPIKPLAPLPTVTWSNHVQPEANSIAVEMEHRTRRGLPPDPRLRPEWREVYEDAVWGVLNLSEFVWIP